MKQLGFILLALGVLAASFCTSLDPHTLPWGWYALALVVAISGVVLNKRAHHAEQKDDAVVADNLSLLQRSLEAVVTNLKAMVAARDTIPAYDFRLQIDAKFRTDLNNFAEARHAISHRFGLQHYAEVMSPFAAGERYLNRIWTASADGYIDEIQLYLDRALEQFEDAQRQLAACD